MAASMGGVDAVTFTGGVGESAAEVRRRAAEGLGFLGLAIDEERNAFPDGDRAVGDATASVPAFVVSIRFSTTAGGMLLPCSAASSVDR